jgi:hypothetical protein
MSYAGNAHRAAPVVWRTTSWGTQYGQLDGLWGPVVASAPWNLPVEVSTSSLRNDSAVPPGAGCPAGVTPCWAQDSYLVDSASSHMLVSKIKPCMSKYKQSIL